MKLYHVSVAELPMLVFLHNVLKMFPCALEAQIDQHFLCLFLSKDSITCRKFHLLAFVSFRFAFQIVICF